MAFERKEISRHFENTRIQLAKYLVKLLMYADYPEKVNEWADEINNKWLLEINDDIELKSDSWFSKEFFKKMFWEGPLGTIKDIQGKMNGITRSMPTLKISQPDAQIIHKQIENIMDAVCADLSTRTFTDIRNYL